MRGANEKANTIDLISKNFKEDYQHFIEKTDELYSSAQSAEIDWSEVKGHFFECRLAYKKVEMLFEYFDREFVKKHINGAPLPSIEQKVPDLTIIQPSGFQIMEETLMEEDEEQMKSLADKFQHQVHSFEQYIPHVKLTDRMVFEAMREELIRLAALGITGFDTPSGENTLAESKAVVDALQNTLSAYNDYTNDIQQSKIQTLHTTGQSYFEIKDMDSFDRFGFIVNYVNPLYAELLDIQKSLYIETRDLVYDFESSINYESKNIFSTDFLNYKYFSSYSNSGNQKEREELGKLLFFDPILSGNNERACASCHDPEKAFSDGLKGPIAFDGEEILERNSPGLLNVVYNNRFFWDARATSPEEQAEHVILNPKEFNSTYEDIITKIQSCAEYLELFAKAYPEFNKINRYTIVASLSAYMQSLRSFNSDFDKMVAGTKIENAAQIQDGFNLFAGKAACATCHFIPTFAGNVPPLYHDSETEVLAVPDVNDQSKAKLDSDLGRYTNKRPKEKADFFKFSFKTPTVRNVELTAPYMHNGVFNTLEEVVDFYDVGGGHGWGIAPENTTLPSDSLNLTTDEKASLIAFMKSLTDLGGFTNIPESLPRSTDENLNNRPIGGSY